MANQVLQTFFRLVEDPNNLLELAQELKGRCEFSLVHTVGEQAFGMINVLDEERQTRELRLHHINKRLFWFGTKRLNLDEEKEKQELELEKFLFESLPDHLSLSEAELHKLKYDIAELLILTIFRQQEKEIEDFKDKQGSLPTNADPLTFGLHLSPTLDLCLEQLNAPVHLLQLSELFYKKKLWGPVQDILQECQKRVNALKKNYSNLLKLKLEKEVLEEEKKKLLKIKKDLLPPQQKRLDDLLARSANLEFNLKDSELDPKSYEGYEELSFTISQKLLKMVTDQIDFLLRPGNENKTRENIEKMKELKTNKLKEILEFIVDEASDDDQMITDDQKNNNNKNVLHNSHAQDESRTLEANVNNPFHVVKLAEMIASYSSSLVLALGKKIRARIEELSTEQEENSALSREYESLKGEKEKLLGQWNVLSPESNERFLKLDIERRLIELWSPFHSSKYDDLALDTAKVTMEAIFHLDTAEEKQVELQTLLEENHNPEHLCQLAQYAQSKKQSDMVVKCGERCQQMIQRVEEKRTIRRPLQLQLDALKAEESALALKHIKLDQAKTEKIRQLEDELNKLPKFPHFARLHDIYQYDELSLEIVQVMTNAILDSKVDLENRIAYRYKTEDPAKIDKNKIEKDRLTLNNRIQALVDICLEKFSNPAYLLKFAESMQQRGEMEIVYKVAVKCMQCIHEVEAHRDLRTKLQSQIDSLNEEKEALGKIKRSLEPEKFQELEELQKSINQLPIWPHFAKLFEFNQYDYTKEKIIQKCVDAVLDSFDKLDADLQKQKFENPNEYSVNIPKYEENKRRVSTVLHQVIQLLKDNNLNPEQIIRIQGSVLAREIDHSNVVLLIAPVVLPRIQNLEKEFQELARLECHIEILKNERQELQSRKKDLAPAQAGLLTQLSAELAQVRYGRNKDRKLDGAADDLSKLYNDLSENVLKATLKGKKNEPKLLEDNVKMCLTFVQNPVFILTRMMEDLKSHRYFDLALLAGNRCQELLVEIKNKKELKNLQERQKEKLLEEKELLSRKRKEMEPEQLQRIRDLDLELSIWAKHTPTFLQVVTENYDLKLVKKMLEIALLKLEDFNNSTAMSDLTADQIDAQKKILEDSIVAVLQQGLGHLDEISLMIKLAKFLQKKKEFKLVILTGLQCEEKINFFHQHLQHRDSLVSQLKQVEQEILMNSLKEGKKAEDRQKLVDESQKLKNEIGELPEIKMHLEALNSFMLEITELVIEAARIENDVDVLREQQMAAFKIDTKQERWDEIRNLTEDQIEWERVKNELVSYIMKRDDDNTTEKIELLLKDELYEQCIEIFPPPSDDDTELELLERLWLEIEKNNPSKLEKIMPVVSKYVKRYFQQYKFENTDKLIDQVQRQYPALVTPLYSAAYDLLLLNILPSQYPIFVSCLKGFKKRLSTLGRIPDWENFFEDFKKKHRGKKRLIQMVNLVGDSCWDLKTLMESKVKTQPKKEAGNVGAAAVATPGKKMKKSAAAAAVQAVDPFALGPASQMPGMFPPALTPDFGFGAILGTPSAEPSASFSTPFASGAAFAPTPDFGQLLGMSSFPPPSDFSNVNEPEPFAEEEEAAEGAEGEQEEFQDEVQHEVEDEEEEVPLATPSKKKKKLDSSSDSMSEETPEPTPKKSRKRN